MLQPNFDIYCFNTEKSCLYLYNNPFLSLESLINPFCIIHITHFFVNICKRCSVVKEKKAHPDMWVWRTQALIIVDINWRYVYLLYRLHIILNEEIRLEIILVFVQLKQTGKRFYSNLCAHLSNIIGKLSTGLEIYSLFWPTFIKLFYGKYKMES